MQIGLKDPSSYLAQFAQLQPTASFSKAHLTYGSIKVKKSN